MNENKTNINCLITLFANHNMVILRCNKMWWHFQDIYDENKNKLILGSEEAPIYTFEL